MTEYVCGFLMDPKDNVLLIRKNRPAWQAGKLNGIGGHIEPGETPDHAMSREAEEEAGITVHWYHFLTLHCPNATIWFYKTFSIHSYTQQTDELLEVWPLDNLPNSIIPNLAWILPLARYHHDRYHPVTVIEK